MSLRPSTRSNIAVIHVKALTENQGSVTRDSEYKDNGDEVVRQLMTFKNPLSSINPRKLLLIGLSLVLESLFTGVQMAGTTIVNAAGHIMLNAYGTTSDQAAMGLGLAYHLWFYYGMLMAMFEKFGIDWSRSFGAKQYHLTRVYFYKAAIVLFTTFALITLPAFWFSEQLLVSVGTDPNHAAATAKVLRLFIIAAGLECTEDLLKSFAMAQGHEAVFGNTIIFSLIPSIGAGYWMIRYGGYGVTGWVYSKILYEMINLTTSAVVLIMKTHPETWGRVSAKSLLDGLGQYFVDSFKYALGSYTEYLGYLIGNYFVILTHDENQIAAFTIIQTVSSLIYTLGEAFATIMRTRMNILIGKKENQAAKTFMIFFYGVTAVFSVLFSGLSFGFREKTAHLFTGSSEKLLLVFGQILFLQVFFAPYHIGLPCTGIGMKTVGLVEELVAWSFYLLVVGCCLTCSVFYYFGRMNSVVAYTVIGVFAYAVLSISVYKTCSEDWTKIELHGDEESADPRELTVEKEHLLSGP